MKSSSPFTKNSTNPNKDANLSYRSNEPKKFLRSNVTTEIQKQLLLVSGPLCFNSYGEDYDNRLAFFRQIKSYDDISPMAQELYDHFGSGLKLEFQQTTKADQQAQWILTKVGHLQETETSISTYGAILFYIGWNPYSNAFADYVWKYDQNRKLINHVPSHDVAVRDSPNKAIPIHQDITSTNEEHVNKPFPPSNMKPMSHDSSHAEYNNQNSKNANTPSASSPYVDTDEALHLQKETEAELYAKWDGNKKDLYGELKKWFESTITKLNIKENRYPKFYFQAALRLMDHQTKYGARIEKFQSIMQKTDLTLQEKVDVFANFVFFTYRNQDWVLIPVNEATAFSFLFKTNQDTYQKEVFNFYRKYKEDKLKEEAKAKAEAEKQE